MDPTLALRETFGFDAFRPGQEEAVRAALADADVDVPASGGLRFHDPWGNAVEIVDYRDVQFTKAPEILRGMGLDGLEKSERALAELREKGLGG